MHTVAAVESFLSPPDRTDMSMNEISLALGYTKLNNTLREVVHELIRSGNASLLYPDKPKCRNQRVRLTE